MKKHLFLIRFLLLFICSSNIDGLYGQEITSNSFRITVVGDLQVNGMEEINYANQTIMPELMGLTETDFYLFMGDLINDKPELFPYIKEMTGHLPSPSKFVFGNHDRDLGLHGIQDSIFTQYFGSSFYSFSHKGVHFIVLNNIYPKGKQGYEGRISDEQLQFVAKDLKKTKNDQLLVLCMHIPLAHTKNKGELLTLLKGRKNILALSAHTHQVSRQFIQEEGVFIHELGIGAACGGWWTGERNWQGIPHAMMQCGSPRNYYIIDFVENKYKIHFKGIGLDPSHQMDIWVSNQDSLDWNIIYEEDLSNKIIANIYGASDSTEVKIQINNGDWTNMKKVSIQAPNVSRIAAWNKADIYPTQYNRKAALRNSNSSHIWIADIPNGLPSGTHTIKIKAIDHFGFSAFGKRMFLTL
jgi:Predicted phosphohydrolases